VEVVRYDAPGWGVGEVATDGERLLYHELPVARPARDSGSHSNHPQGIPEIPVVSVSGSSSRVRAGFATRVARLLSDYFAGNGASFDGIALDLAGCTAFQRALTLALRAVPRGETVTYGELAALAGRPNAPRAAGTFCAHNRFGIVVPCHRVVAAGGLGAYGSLGPDYKRRLLALEGADVPL
jgi:methylated-DNA-[protein]-cysteine S-methyltransferase